MLDFNIISVLNGAIITDLFVMWLMLIGQIKSKTLREWYNSYGISAVIADVLSIVIGVIIASYLYPLLFSKYNIFKFLVLTVCVQLVHDLLFSQIFMSSRGSRILDTFKAYAKEMGPIVLFADACMMVSTVLISKLIDTYKINYLLIFTIYLVPYFLYSL